MTLSIKRGTVFLLSVACLMTMLLPGLAYADFAQPIGKVEVPEEMIAQLDSVFLLDVTSNTVLYSKNEKKSISPVGSAVQLMSAYVVACEAEWNKEIPPIEELYNLSAGARTIGIDPSSSTGWVIKDLVAAMMLHGARDAAMMLADHVGGSMGTYAEKMNTYAQELGMSNTIYADPLGGYNSEQTTTVEDLALLGKAALDNEQLKQIIATPHYDAVNGMRIESRMYVTQEGKNTYDPRVYGIGEGYTDYSGTNSLMFMSHDGREWLMVSHAEGDSIRNIEAIASALFDFLIDKYAYCDPSPAANALLSEIVLKAGTNTEITLKSAPCTLLAESKVAQDIIEGKALTLGELPAVPVSVMEGDELGEVSLLYNGQAIATLQVVVDQVKTVAAGLQLIQNDDEKEGIPVYTLEDWEKVQKEPTFIDKYGFYIVTGGVILLAAAVLAIGTILRRKMR